METDYVRYSRAGDAFHYRWAARRCLQMIHPTSTIKHIVIEGSKENKASGELVIDVSEYYESDNDDKRVRVVYYQLKHSTTRKHIALNLSDLKKTVEGFSERYRDLCCGEGATYQPVDIKFRIITNRPFSRTFREGVQAISEGNSTGARFTETIERYTELTTAQLRTFCASLEVLDGEGDYNAQKFTLHAEISELLAGSVADALVDNVISLVQDRALPHSHGIILPEEILQRLGADASDLFPACPELEDASGMFEREQLNDLLAKLLDATSPTIIRASGGVGKSILVQQLARSLPFGSLGIVYDCFGSGKYRNPSRPRHRHRDALVQIANEIAERGLCRLLIPRQNDQDDAVLRAFLSRLKTAALALRKAHKDPLLFVFIDAADNSELAAQESGHTCFAHQLLRVDVPEGCRIVMLCRPERVYLLQPPTRIQTLDLNPFSLAETSLHIRKNYPDASDNDGIEFHRLTGGNPRVQANALAMHRQTVSEMLSHLGPSGTTVEDLIEEHVASALDAVKEMYPANYQERINSICLGLANLLPFIPIQILATVADVDESAVVSFVTDLGRPLLITEGSVHFRDEPTETWFKQKYAASPEQTRAFVDHIKPLASEFTYVAEVLPSLLLLSEDYDQLIALALSDDYLPNDNPIDERNVRVHRLQFAFKAALRQERYADAAKLALRAGEEVAGDSRQLVLLKNNIDLIAPLQSQQRVQELAFRRSFGSGWDGSENIYSASLLATVTEFKGEARGFLRSAENWLRLYFEERDKCKEERFDESLEEADIAELLYAHLSIHGPRHFVESLRKWRPPDLVFKISRVIIRRLVDAAHYKTINKIAYYGSRLPYLMLAIVDELMTVGHSSRTQPLEPSLRLLTHKRSPVPKSLSYWQDKNLLPAIVSYAESCYANELPKRLILRFLRRYLPQRASLSCSSGHQRDERRTFLRATALRTVLLDNDKPSLDELMPVEYLDEDNRRSGNEDIDNFNHFIGGLLPWYLRRAHLLDGISTSRADDVFDYATKPTSYYREHDSLPYEISYVKFELFMLDAASSGSDVIRFIKQSTSEDGKLWFQDRLKALRSSCRLEHLKPIRRILEHSCYRVVTSVTDEGPESQADDFIRLSRAVLPLSKNDSSAYFDLAIEAVSKFGDELVDRWNTVVKLADKASETCRHNPETAYRFIRVAELVGNTVCREKHWDRGEAIRTCVRLCPTSALAALSRWRDRDVGRFSDQLSALIEEMVCSNLVPPSVGWSLSPCFAPYQLADLAVLCMTSDIDIEQRQHILNTAVRDLRLTKASEEDWRKLEEIAERLSIRNDDLDSVLLHFSMKPNEDKEEPLIRISDPGEQEEDWADKWDEIFKDLELITSEGLSTAIARFRRTPTFRSPYDFWDKVKEYVSENNACDYLRAIVFAENADIYDICRALSHFPAEWRQKASVIRVWPEILSGIGQRFAVELTSEYYRRQIAEAIDRTEYDHGIIEQNVISGLGNSCNMIDASAFFNFVKLISSVVTAEEATDLLQYAISRFELHIEEDYGDGPWSDWLLPPENNVDAFTGLVWAALGSPRTEVRWRAAHCVRRLAEASCKCEIDSLMKWMEHGNADAFGCSVYPFYNLHARQYLLIALARAAIDSTEVLRKHYKVFAYHALESIPHALIQEVASKIALSIEFEFQGTYEKGVACQLQAVGTSQMPTKKANGRSELFATPWHARGEVDKSLKVYFAYDFDRYWFDPLADVFGISSQQVEELAREVVLKEWCVNVDNEHILDPREKLWRSHRYEKETWHSHCSYPETDNYRFYLSYHAMFSVAAKLLLEMPIVNRYDEDEDEWKSWLHRHSLTRYDGRWLADRRDAPPLNRRAWLSQTKSDNWQWEIWPEDFIDGLLVSRDDKTWVNIRSMWSDTDGHSVEDYQITSAFVSPDTSDSLLNALTSCSNPTDYKLPDYCEERMEFLDVPFELIGWTLPKDPDNRLDQFDPHAGHIGYPPYEVGKKYAEKFGLIPGPEQREWFKSDAKKSLVLSELWSDGHGDYPDSPFRYGDRLLASLNLLVEMCSVLKMDLIIEVQIKRYQHRSYRTRSDDEFGYIIPNSKVYLLAADGTLRDQRTRYQLR